MRKLELLTGGVARVRAEKFRLARAPWHVINRQYHKAGDAAGGTRQYGKQDDDLATAIVLAAGQPMIQSIGTSTFSANNSAQGQVINQVMNNVGLNTKITVEVSGTITQAVAETLKRTPWGLANFFTNIQLTDLSNLQRINTTGQHLFALACLRRQMVFGASYVNDAPVNMGSNFQVNNGPNAVTAAQTFRMFFEIPLAYHDNDFRGAIWAGVTNAQWRVSLTINPNFIVGSGTTDTLNAAYQSTTAGDVGLLSNVTVQVYQHYIDQIPRDKNGQPILPLMSLAFNYMLINTIGSSALAATIDIPVQYANFRDFISTMVIYDNAGTYNAGSDINYMGIQVANLTFLEKIDPYMATLRTRNLIGDDFPKGTYIFDHRRKPIRTNNFGNTQFVINPSQVNAGAQLLMFYEMLAVQNQAINAGSLAAS